MPAKAIPTSLWSPERVAEYLGCSKVTVYRLIHRGELKASKIGKFLRIDPRDLQRACKPVNTYQPSADFLAELNGGDAA